MAKKKVQVGTEVPDKLDKLTDDELHELWNTVAEETLERREANRRIAQEVGKRAGVEAVKAKIASLNDNERAYLRQLIETESIESEEAVGPEAPADEKAKETK